MRERASARLRLLQFVGADGPPNGLTSADYEFHARTVRRLLRDTIREELEAAAERMEQAMHDAPVDAWEEGPHRPHHLRRICWAAITNRRAIVGGAARRAK